MIPAFSANIKCSLRKKIRSVSRLRFHWKHPNLEKSGILIRFFQIFLFLSVLFVIHNLTEPITQFFQLSIIIELYKNRNDRWTFSLPFSSVKNFVLQKKKNDNFLQPFFRELSEKNLKSSISFSLLMKISLLKYFLPELKIDNKRCLFRKNNA